MTIISNAKTTSPINQRPYKIITNMSRMSKPLYQLPLTETMMSSFGLNLQSNTKLNKHLGVLLVITVQA